MRQDLKVIRLAQRSDQEAKGIDIVDSRNYSNEQKKTNRTKETSSSSRNTKATHNDCHIKVKLPSFSRQLGIEDFLDCL